MHCYYCGAPHQEDDHRCRRCGRRLEGYVSPPKPQHPATRTSPIRQSLTGDPIAASVSEPAKPRTDIPAVRPRPLKRTVANPVRCAPKQGQLFASPVIRFDEFSSSEKPRGERRPQPTIQGEKKAAPRRKIIPAQQALFPPPPPTEQPLGRTRSDPSVRYSQYRVAQPVHRVMAAFMDMGIIVIGVIPIWVFFAPQGAICFLARRGWQFTSPLHA